MATEIYKNTKALSMRSREAWRTWLEKNHAREQALWLILFNKNSGESTVQYEEAVEEALCFGWIDSVPNKRDEKSRYQYFSKRKPKSNWSQLNRQRAERMIAAGLMRPAGQAMIDLAKKTGTWEALVEVQEAVIPDDLMKLFKSNRTAYKNFLAFAPSSKRGILEWILNAKRPETRQKRLEETVNLAAKNLKANHYRQ